MTTCVRPADCLALGMELAVSIGLFIYSFAILALVA